MHALTNLTETCLISFSSDGRSEKDCEAKNVSCVTAAFLHSEFDMKNKACTQFGRDPVLDLKPA